MTRKHSVVLYLTDEEYVHIMGSVSQADAEYCICPKPLKDYLESVAVKYNIRDKRGDLPKIGWGT